MISMIIDGYGWLLMLSMVINGFGLLLNDIHGF